MSTTPCTTDSLATVDSFADAVAEIRQQRYLVIRNAKDQWLFDAKKKLIDDIKRELSNAKTHMTDNLPVNKLPKWIIYPGNPLILTTKTFPPEVTDNAHYMYCRKEMEALCRSLGVKAEIELNYAKYDSQTLLGLIIKIRWPEKPPSEDDLNRRKAHDLDFANEFYSKSRMY